MKLTKLEQQRAAIGVPVIAGPRKPIPRIARVARKPRSNTPAVYCMHGRCK